MRFFVLLFALAAGLAFPALPASFCCGGVPAMILDGTPTVTGTKDTPLVPFTMTASYGAAPVTFSLVSGTFPTGVTLNATTGVVSGTPTNSGTFADIVIGAEDSWAPIPHRTAQFHAFTMTIASPASAITVSGTPTTTATVGALMTPFTVTSSGGTGPYTYSLYSGALPSGVTLGASTGVVSGTPAADYDGTYTRIVIRSTDSLAAVGNLAGYDFVVNAASPALAQTLTGLTPTPYVYPATHSSGAILTLHGLSLGLRNNANPVELDADGNSEGSMWYGAISAGSSTPDWPPGYPSTPPYTVAPLVVNQSTTNYPFRQQLNPNVFVRGGRWIGSVSSTGEAIHLAMYPYDTTNANTHIVTPSAWPACYDGDQSDPPIYNTWTNINATGTSGTNVIRSGASLAPISTMFVGEEVSSPYGTTGIPADAHIATLPGTPDLYTFTIDKTLTSTVTKITLRGCTAFYNNAAAAIFDSYGTSSLVGARMDHVWDGPRTCAISHIVGSSPSCLATINRLWITETKDDCIESDHNYSLTVTNSLFDGCQGSAISSDQVQNPSAFATDTITVVGSLMRMEAKPDASNNPVDPFYTYNAPFKLGTGAPAIVFQTSIIALDGADAARIGRWNSLWTNMTTGNGNCVSSATNDITGLVGNYFLWLPDDDLPSSSVIGTIPTACFPSGHIQTGATARATWAAAKLAMQTYLTSHGVYRLSSDP